jgi:hypothetical protein
MSDEQRRIAHRIIDTIDDLKRQIGGLQNDLLSVP